MGFSESDALLINVISGAVSIGAYSLYALAAVVSVFFVIRYVHETRGLELEEMEG